MTASEFAEKTGIPYQTVARWLKRNMIPGVRIKQFGKFKVYMIPESAVETVQRPKMGRPKKATAKKSSKKGGGK